jgi:hypothetical protein
MEFVDVIIQLTNRHLQIKLQNGSTSRTHWYHGGGEGFEEGLVMKKWKLQRKGQLVAIVGSKVI